MSSRGIDGERALVISSDQIRRLLPMADAIQAVARAYSEVTRGTVEQPARLVTADGGLIAMLARSRSSGRASSKTVAITLSNRPLGLPTLHALVTLFDDTGSILALIEGGTLTALRTGAGVGAATALLAPEHAGTLAIVGAGGQAPDQIRAVLAVRPIEEVRIVSRHPERATNLAHVMRQSVASVDFRAVRTIEEATVNAEVICCATNATEPLLHPAHLGARGHVNAIGAYRPDMCELHPHLLSMARLVVVDELEAAKLEAGDLIQAVERGQFSWDRAVEIGQLLGSDRSTGATDGWTVFKSVGLAAQDLALADLVYERAAEDPETQQVKLGGKD